MINGATVGALAGSVIDTGGVSIPAVAAVLKIKDFSELGVDAIDAGIKNRSEKFTAQEKKAATKEVIKDLAGIVVGAPLSPKASVSLDVLVEIMKKLDQYFGEDIYKNVNEKYGQSSENAAGTQGSSFSGTSVSGVNGNPSQPSGSWGRSQNPVGTDQYGNPIWCWGFCN